MKKILCLLAFGCLSTLLFAQYNKVADSLSNVYEKVIYYNETPFFQVELPISYHFSKPKIETPYESVFNTNINQPFMAAKRNNFWGLIDSTGKEIGKWDYDQVYFNNVEKFWVCNKNNKMGVINLNGKEILPPIYDKVFGDQNGFWLLDDQKLGFADFEGRIRIPVMYDSRNFNLKNNYYIVHKDSLATIGKLSSNSKITEGVYSEAIACKYGFIVTQNNKKGIIDTTGKVILPIEEIDITVDGLGLIQICKKISKEKNTSSEVVFSDYKWGTNQSSTMSVCKDDSITIKIWGLYDISGAEILPPIYENLERNSKGLFIATLNNKKGLITQNGEIILPFQFDKIGSLGKKREWIITSIDYTQSLYMNGKVLVDSVTDYSISEYLGKQYLWVNTMHNQSYLIDNTGILKKYPLTFYFFGGFVTGANEKKQYLITPNKKRRIHNFEDNSLFTYHCKNFYSYKYVKQDKSIVYVFNEAGKRVAKINNCAYIDFHEEVAIASCLDKKKSAYIDVLYNLENGKSKNVTKNKYDQIAHNEEKPLTFTVTDFEDKTYTIDKNGKLIPESEMPKMYFTVDFSAKQGVIDTFGREIVPVQYKHLYVYSNIMIGAHAEVYDVFNFQGQKISSNNQLANKDLVVQNTLKKQGVIDVKGNVIIPAEYDQIFKEKNLYIAKKNNLWGVLSSNGNIKIPFKYTSINVIDTNLIVLVKKHQAQLVDTIGKKLTSQKFNDISNGYFSNNLFLVAQRNGKVVLLNKKGERISHDIQGVKSINRIYKDNYASNRSTSLLSIELEDKSAYINQEGKVSPMFDDIMLFDGYLKTHNAPFWGIMDTNFVEILPTIYKNILYGNKNHFILQQANDKYVLYSVLQKKVISDEYSILSDYNGRSSLVFSNDSLHYGLIDTTGKIVFPPQLEKVGIFYKNNVVAQLNGKSGILNEQGKWLLQPEYEALGLMENGYAIIKEDCKYRLISPEGQIISEEYDFISEHPNYDNITVRNRVTFENLFLVVKDGKSTFIDSKGQPLAPTMFDEMKKKIGNFLIVMKNGKWGAWDIQQQKLIVPNIYKDVQVLGINQEKAYFSVENDNGTINIINHLNEVIYPNDNLKMSSVSYRNGVLEGFIEGKNMYIFNTQTETLELKGKTNIKSIDCFDKQNN